MFTGSTFLNFQELSFPILLPFGHKTMTRLLRQAILHCNKQVNVSKHSENALASFIPGYTLRGGAMKFTCQV